MSVHPREWTDAKGRTRRAFEVRYREGDRNRSKTFARERDAKTFDAEVTRRKRLGTLAELDRGTESLDEYVEEVWTPTHGATLSAKTQTLYAGLYDHHLTAPLGGLQLREINPEVIARWQADRLASGAGPVAVAKALSLLGSILQRAVEGGRIPRNPARLVKRAPLPRRSEVRPLAPETVERMRAAASPRDATLLSVLAYAGLRPGEALALKWGDVRDRTLLVERALSLGAEKDTKNTKHRTVRLLGPLARDLAEWRLRSGRPDDRELVFPGVDGQPWSERAYQSWRRRAFARAFKAAGVGHAKPYHLRHSFASLLFHEGRSVIYVARQLGHGAALTLSTYGHVIDELEDSPQLDAETAISAAREGASSHDVRKTATDGSADHD